jgi:single-stranded-DNA-specific exonuclease
VPTKKAKSVPVKIAENIFFEPPLHNDIKIADSLEVDPLIVNILYNRGLESQSEIKDFMNGKIRWEQCPINDWGESALEKARPAIDRILQAVENDEKILIYGDADVDGVTSTSVMFEALKLLMVSDVDWFVPTKEMGFGLQTPEVIKDFADRGGTLVITVDCASNDGERIKKLPVDIVVIDHHTPGKGSECPELIVNPKLSHPNSELAGVGVTWLTVWSLFEKKGINKNITEDFLARELDLVALGTVADKCSLTGFNHTLVKTGLRVLNAMDRVGIRMLFDTMGYDWERFGLTAEDIGWKFGPRINAVCRTGGSVKKTNRLVEMLTTNSRLIAKRCAKVAEDVYRKYREDRDNVAEKIHIFIDDPDAPIITIEINAKYLNSSGIIASQICDEHNRPALVVGRLNDGSFGGSGRRPQTMGSFDLRDFIDKRTPEEGWAKGHGAAFGLSIPGESWGSFIKTINKEMEEVKQKNPDAFKPPSIVADARVEDFFDVTNQRFIEQMSKLIPFGMGNPKPVFYTPDIYIESVRQISANFWLADIADMSGETITAKGFGECPYKGDVQYSGVVYTLSKSKEYGMNIEIITVIVLEGNCAEQN